MDDKQGLLSMRLVKSRNYVACRKNVDEIMYKFEEYRFKCHYIEPPRITPSYEIRMESFSNNYSDKVGNYVAKKIDLEDEVTKFYEELSKALQTLCREELIYFKNTYYNRLKEESICDLLNMSRDSLRRIKESCIIKIAMYYDIDVMATEK